MGALTPPGGLLGQNLPPCRVTSAQQRTDSRGELQINVEYEHRPRQHRKNGIFSLSLTTQICKSFVNLAGLCHVACSGFGVLYAPVLLALAPRNDSKRTICLLFLSAGANGHRGNHGAWSLVKKDDQG